MQFIADKEVGKYIETKLFSVQKYATICTPSISYDYGVKILNMAKNGIKIKIITSNSGAGETNSVHEIVKEFLRTNTNLEYKIVDTKEVFIHAKLYVMDGIYAVIGSANFTKESFWNNIESIAVFEDPGDIKIIESEFNNLWTSYSSTEYINSQKKKKLQKIISKFT